MHSRLVTDPTPPLRPPARARVRASLVLTVGLALALPGAPARAAAFFFSTGNPDGLLGMASRPAPAFGEIPEIEAADDFAVMDPVRIDQIGFTGLVPTGAVVQSVRIEIYRVFPQDSDLGRTSGPPTFSTSAVPTRVNSPSDVAFATRAGSSLQFLTAVLQPSFAVANSVVDGIAAGVGGDGAAVGDESFFTVVLAKPLDLPPGHYFLVPQVELDGGDFLWLSSPRPIVPPGTPFALGTTDLQAWIRNGGLDPDWLRVGTDIIGSGHAFNGAFSLSGVVPEPGRTALDGAVLPALGFVALRRRRSRP